MKFLSLFLAFTMALSGLPVNAQFTPVQEQVVEKNYIKNGGFEGGIAGWKAYKDAAGSLPVDGVSGSPALTITSSTSSPIAGKASGIITHSAANLQGEGIAIPFTVEKKDKGKVLTISGSYEILTGTYSGGTSSTDSDLVASIYDVDAAQVIQPAGYKLDGGVIGANYPIAATFQTNISSTNYRLIIHVATTTATAYTLKLDGIKVGPQNKSQGPPVTDWVKYTPNAAVNQGFGTISSDDLYWRRLGSNVEVRGNFTVGTSTASEARLALPNGLVSTTDSVQNAISGTYARSAVATTHGGFILKQNGVNYVLFSHSGTFSNTSVIAANPDVGNQAGGTGERLTVNFSIPISGWGSTVTMSDSSDSRVVSFSGYVASNQALTANVTNLPLTTFKDTHGGWTGSTYVIPVPGDYLFSSGLASTASSTSMSLYKNGTLWRNIQSVSTSEFKHSSLVLPDLKAGDIISIRADGAITIVADTDAVAFSISKISGPSQIAASESVAMRYTSTAGTSIPNTGDNLTPYAVKDYDTHNSYNTSTGVYTCPLSGKYRASGVSNYSSQAYAAGNIVIMSVYKNGSIHSYGPYTSIIATGTNIFGASINTTVNCNAGETIDFRLGNTRTAGATTLLTSTGTNHIEIERIGN